MQFCRTGILLFVTVSSALHVWVVVFDSRVVPSAPASQVQVKVPVDPW